MEEPRPRAPLRDISAKGMPAMTNPDVGPLDTISARNRLSGLYAKGSTPDPQVEEAARTQLATAKIDKAIREAVLACPYPLHHAQVEYLCGLIEAAGRAGDERR